MKKVLAIVVIVMMSSSLTFAQKYFTKNGNVTFFSKAPLEDIKAVNKKAVCVIDAGTGAMEFAVLMKAFEFEKALMQEHFNENYVESDTYPKGTFKGKITNVSSVNFTTDGSYPVTIAGKMTIHGITKDVTAKGSIVVAGGKINGISEFTLLVADYDIEIPSVVKDKISKSIKITVNVWLEPKS